MAEHWRNAPEFRDELTKNGWVTPDTYCPCWAEVTNDPAVYLFLLYRHRDYDRALVAYVGMSTALKNRLATHNVYPELKRPGYWPMRWFKPCPRGLLRDVERHYIQKFEPPWNIVGRQRGISLDG